MNILESFKSFNEQHNNQPFITADDIVAHLDKTCPDWKGKIRVGFTNRQWIMKR